MKKLTNKQIKQVKNITCYQSTQFHGNTKKVGEIFINDFKEIVYKKKQRQLYKHNCVKTKIEHLKELIAYTIKFKNTTYCKNLILGNTGIYYASINFGHKDYNKTRVFDITPQNLKLMNLFNKIVK